MMRRVSSRFGASERAVAAVEFAVTFPVLLFLLLAGAQLVTYVTMTRKVELVANSISQMISQKAPPVGSTTALVNWVDMHFSYDSAMVLFPANLKSSARLGVPWWSQIRIDYASIQFTPILPVCATPSNPSLCYLANVVWTSTGTYTGNNRVCVIPQLPMSDTAPPNRLYLPKSTYGPGSLIVIDVVYTYQPSFGSTFFPNLRIARSVYVQPRYAQLINYDPTNSDGIASKCPGY